MRVARVLPFVTVTILAALLWAGVVLADCGGPLNPCTYCGDGEVQCPNDDGQCEECDGAIGCGSGYSCFSCSCFQTGCNYDGSCDPPIESHSNCPSDCDPPCSPDCTGKECGDDGCGGSCGSCLLPAVCQDFQCCAPFCPAASTIACGSTYSGGDGCGGSCSVTGSACSVPGEWCFLGSCIECRLPFQCDDQNVCTDDSCTGGDCVNAPVPGRSCSPVGGGAGECDSQGDCVATCTPPLADCDGDGSCETNTNADPSNCGSCGSSCNWDQMCDTGNCVCGYNPVLSYCDTQECGEFTVCGAMVNCGDCPACETDADCDPGESCCDGKCIDTQQNPDHCGACDTHCSGLAPWCVAASCIACRDSNDCSAGETCQSGSCVPSSCVPDCTGKVCGADGCGGSCGSCAGGQSCDNGACACPDGSVWNGLECDEVVCSNGATESCYDGPSGTQNVGVCVAGSKTCSDNAWGACTNQVLPGTEVCNGLDDDCDGLVDNGNLCGPGELCTVGACTPSTYVLFSTIGNIRVMEGRWFSTDISIVPEIDFSLQTAGFDVTVDSGPPFTLSGMSDSPGEWTLDLEAHHFGLLAQLSIPIKIHCDPSYECCDEGEIYYNTNREPCTLTNGDPGICTEEGCVENCIDSYELRCHDNDLWYFDSCGHPQTLSQACDGVCSVVNGEPTCQEVTTCDNTPYRRCTGNVVEYVDECYRVSVEQECTSGEQCVDAECQPLPPCHAAPGTINCEGSCVDPLTDRTHCGGCDRSCGRNEQCVQGMCALIPGCVVICDTNDECSDNHVCVHPGSCTESACEPINILEQNDTALRELSELLREGLVQVNTTIDGNQFRYTVTNLAGTPLENVSITTAFNKLIASSAQLLQVHGVDYEVLEDDPVLAFKLPSLDSTTEFTVTTPKTLTEDDLGLATILNITYVNLLSLWNATKDALTIGLNSEFDGEDTTFHLTLNPDKGLDGVSIPVEIPKCMAEYASEMELGGNYQIINEDPLIVWQFDQLNKPTAITFSVPGDIDEDCKAQLRAMAIARAIGKPLNPWFAILLIPLVGTLLIFFQRFTPDNMHKQRMKKEDYVQIGKAQGMNDDEIKRAWKDYKRRF